MPEHNLHHPITANILALFEDRGDSQYGGEAVTQREHALQAACLAQQAGASPALIVASLLHDLGHLLHGLPEDAPEQGVDDVHEELAARWLKQFFGAEVIAPVQLHVAAKRYLSRDADYRRRLSAPSEQSLMLQGGPMSDAEAAEFAAHLHFDTAVQLRKWDDEAKIAGLKTPPIAHFAGYIDQVLQESGLCR
jgi:phosphonate degradation associated HDIG domain protein